MAVPADAPAPDFAAGRDTYFRHFTAYVTAAARTALEERDARAAIVARINSVQPASMTEALDQLNTVERLQRGMEPLEGRLRWLRAAAAIASPRPRQLFTAAPSWSFAGDLTTVASDIERLVTRTVDVGRGARDDLPLVYVSNPPRHGKSLLLDTLFRSSPNVCVLSATYNAATMLHACDLGGSAEDAVRGLLLRLLNSLVFGLARWEELWENSPLMTATNPVSIFEHMLGLTPSDGAVSNGAPSPLLIAIDEISKLTDHPSCVWARSVDENKKFWRMLFSLTRATRSWVRIVMTGFTDSPQHAVSASDVACYPCSLSLLDDPEAALLPSELVWAYAVANVQPFPGLLWALVKSTPGLLGLWAQQLNLHSHSAGVPCVRCAGSAIPSGVVADISAAMRADLGNLSATVPWAAVLDRDRARNWPLIVRFLVEEDALTSDVVRAARNAELATVLNGSPVLSPFAVAVTILALRGRPLPLDASGAAIGADIFVFLNGALSACEAHGAGCASNMPHSWRTLVQRRLRNAERVGKLRDSQLLHGDPRLSVAAPALVGGPVAPGVSVESMGLAHENFVLHAFALRLQCLMQRAAQVGAPPPWRVDAADLLPPAVGTLLRPAVALPAGLARHAIESNLAVSFAVEPGSAADMLAKLCTRTASLMLPTPVTMILEPAALDRVQRSLMGPPPAQPLPAFAFASVAVATEAECPTSFPTFANLVAPDNELNVPLRIALLAALTAAAAANAPLDVAAFVNAPRPVPFGNVTKLVHAAVESLCRVTELARRAATDSQVVLFKPTSLTNALCDVVAIFPCAGAALYFVCLEVRDRTSANVDEKLSLAQRSELMLAPLAERLAHDGIIVVGAMYVVVARAAFALVP